MHIKRWVVGLGAAALLTTLAWGQNIITQAITGNEVVRIALSPGGTDFLTNVNALRGKGFTAVATGTTVNTTVPNTSQVVVATGAITTWNVTLPTAPFNGQVLIIGCPGGNVTTLAISGLSPAAVAITGTNPTSCTSGGTIAQGAGFVYSSSANAWLRFL